MLVNIQVQLEGKTVEDYTAPNGSWIQCNAVGAQYLPSLEESEGHRSGEYLIVLTPVNPIKIPEKLKKLLNGHDKTWGRNGREWIGLHRARSGGTTLDRARELHAKWSFLGNYNDFPLGDDPSTTDFLNHDYKKTWFSDAQ